jgi:tRNA pseudouridine38-40 synthase
MIVQLTLEYDGSGFSGWQRQPHARTVEGVLRDAFAALKISLVALTAAGRTDAGAHAHGQVVGVTFQETSFPWTPERLQAGLNAALPHDVVVIGAAAAPEGFHARRDALRRTYRYVVAPRGARMAVARQYAWQVRGPLDVEAMRRAARLLTGTHDFAAFGRSPRPGGSTMRTVFTVNVRQIAIPAVAPEQPRPSVVLIDVDADAFLYGMMRSFAGALVAVGEGRLSERELHEMVVSPPAQRAHLTVAPAHGLHQWAVTYPETR